MNINLRSLTGKYIYRHTDVRFGVKTATPKKSLLITYFDYQANIFSLK